jgi:hypothetical protein
MMGFNRGIGLAVAVLAIWLAGPAGAQESLDSGKTGAQLFASDCATCHKNAASLAKAGGLFGLANFLREHYTASRRSAAVIAAYVESVGRAQAPGRRPGAGKRAAKGDEKAKAGSGEARSGMPAEARTSEPKASEPKPEAKANQPKPDTAPTAKPDKP